jgi:hypothetical protein
MLQLLIELVLFLNAEVRSEKFLEAGFPGVGNFSRQRKAQSFAEFSSLNLRVPLRFYSYFSFDCETDSNK